LSFWETPSLRLESVVFHFIVDAHGFRLLVNAGLNRQDARESAKSSWRLWRPGGSSFSLVTRDVPADGVFA
jgi:hypothetical protein